MSWVLSCETGFFEVPIYFADEKATSSHAMNGECGMDLAQSETPCAWRSPLCGTWEASCRPQPRPAVPGQSGKLGRAKPGRKA